MAVPGALPGGHVRVLAVGKAAQALAGAAARLLGSRIRSGLVVSNVPGLSPAPFEFIQGAHPVPDAGSERAGRRALDLAASVAPDETLVVLLSGGGSAMLAVPADGISLDDKRRTTDRLLRAGADIHALNTVRKHLSAIKGGWLATGERKRGREGFPEPPERKPLPTPFPSVTFAISDVVGDDLSVIASGPTVADPSTFDDAVGVLRRYGGLESYPASVAARFEAGARGQVPETPKPGDPRLARTTTTVIGGRRDAMEGAAIEAEARGYHVLRVGEPVVGEARSASAAHLRASVERARHIGRPACVVSSGETTVRVTGSGKGGRNQEFALAAADLIDEGREPDLQTGSGPVAVASVGTDGVDGPTEAAGAVVDPTTLNRARTAGLGPPGRYLDDNNAFAFFEPLGDLIITGPTDTNVGDLQIILFG